MSANELKLRQAFVDGLGVPATDVGEQLIYGVTPGWDSVAHMALVAAIDSAFDIMLDIDDVIDMSSFTKSKEILAKYGISF